jgi:uncharacterized protein with PIN domain
VRPPREAAFRFYGALNDFLPRESRQRTLTGRFHDRPAIKDPIEAFGVPHPEVGLVVVDGTAVDFGYRLAPGDRVAVYPEFSALDTGPAGRLRKPPRAPLTFILDVHLGKLARRLRLLGIDAAYRNDLDDWEIVGRAREQERIILTRDRGLLRIGAVIHGAWIRATDPELQVTEVLARFDLARAASPFTRCIECNGRLGRADADAIARQVPADVQRHCAVFGACESCGRIYWPGSHHARLSRWVQHCRDRTGRV